MKRPLVFLVPLVGVIFYWTGPCEVTLLTAPEAGPHAQALIALTISGPGPVHHHRLRLAPGPRWGDRGRSHLAVESPDGKVGVGPLVVGSEIASNDGDPPDMRPRGWPRR